MKVNLLILGLITLTVSSCSNDSKNIKNQTGELIIEENEEIKNSEYSNEGLKTNLNDLKTINDEREKHLNLLRTKNDIIDVNDDTQKMEMSKNLKELEFLNKEQENFKKETNN